MGNLKEYGQIERAIFEEIRRHVDFNLRLGKGSSKTPKFEKDVYVLYAPEGVNYKLKVKKPKFGSLPARRFKSGDSWYQFGFGDLYLKKPEDTEVKKNVVYWNLPEVNKGGVFVAYEKLIDDGEEKTAVLNVDRLKNRNEESGQYEKVAQIPLSYLYDWRNSKTDSFFVTDGYLDGIQKNSFSSDKAGIYKDKALMNLVKGVLMTQNVYGWPLPKKEDKLPTTYKETNNAHQNGLDAFLS